jgi:subtilisin family serine protease
VQDGWPSEFGTGNDGLVVAASTQTDGIWSGSTLGRVRVFAPGDHVRTAWYTSNTATTDQESGTSLAAPHVSGVIALKLEFNPVLESYDLVQHRDLIATPNLIQGNLHGADNWLAKSLVAGNTDGNGGPPNGVLTLQQQIEMITILQAAIAAGNP